MEIVVTYPIFEKKKKKEELVKKCVNSGIDSFRMNLSKLDTNDVDIISDNFELIRKIGQKSKIIIDIPYPKSRKRVSLKKSSNLIKKDERINIFNQEDKDYYIQIDDFRKYFYKDKIYYYADGEGAFIAKKVLKNFVELKSVNEFCMRTNKTITTEIININGDGYNYIEIVNRFMPDEVWLSFTENLKEIQHFVENGNGRTKIIAKIESRYGISNLHNFIKQVDGVAVARGDLGLSVPIENLWSEQEKIIECAKLYNKKVYVATDILTSMKENLIPCRADVIDLSVMCKSKVDGIMLNVKNTYSDNLEKIVELVNNINKLYMSS